jgi:hypothetical protein
MQHESLFIMNGKLVNVISTYILKLDEDNKVYHFQYSDLATRKQEIEETVDKIVWGINRTRVSEIEYLVNDSNLIARFAIQYQ